MLALFSSLMAPQPQRLLLLEPLQPCHRFALTCNTMTPACQNSLVREGQTRLLPIHHYMGSPCMVF